MSTLDKLDGKTVKASANMTNLLGNGRTGGGWMRHELSEAGAADAEAVRSVVREELLSARKEMAREMEAENQALLDATSEFKRIVADNIDSVRAFRMTVVREVTAAIAPLLDVRKFFPGPDHAEEMRRLGEFVLLMEKLDALKSSGFMDAVADTILRLSEEPSEVRK